MKNWAGNLEYGAARIHRPSTVDELREIVCASTKIRGLGSRHSFNRIADTDADLVSMENFSAIEDVNVDEMSVTLGGGVTYGQLAPVLQAQGFALPNLASLPHISVAGAISTGTHGSGVQNGSLSSSVKCIEFLDEDGTLIHVDSSASNCHGTIVSLGALGLITQLTLEVVPTFDVAQTVYLDLPFNEGLTHFTEVMSCAYSVSLFTDWNAPTFSQVWVKRVGDPPDFPFAKPATRKMHPLPDSDPINCTDQLGVSGPWLDRLPHFKMGFTPSGGVELQTEYLVAFEDAPAALRALNDLRAEIAPLLFISEIRTVASDELWLSPAYRRNSVAIHFTWKQLQPEVEAVIPRIEKALEPFKARPHWGKLFAMNSDKLAGLYPRFDDFIELAKEFDPSGKFRNKFLEDKFFGV